MGEVKEESRGRGRRVGWVKGGGQREEQVGVEGGRGQAKGG